MARFFTALGLPLFLLLLSGNLNTSAFSAEPGNANQSEAASTGIPPVPDGTPKEMLDYIRSIRQPAARSCQNVAAANDSQLGLDLTSPN